MTAAPLVPGELLDAVDATLRLLDAHPATRASLPATSEPLPSLLEQCQQSCVRIAAQKPEPVRTIHHFACTGEDKIRQHLAHVPNTYVLDNLDPLSDLPRPDFVPSELILQLRNSGRSVGNDLLADVFIGGVNALYRQCCDTGMRLVLGEHSHSRYCTGQKAGSRPGLRQLLQQHFPVLSVVTVRHPLDSFLDLTANKQGILPVRTLEEYARDYHAFLDACDGVPLLRFEDLLTAPKKFQKDLCTALDLPFDADALDLVLPVEQMRGGDKPEQGRIFARHQDIPEHILKQITPDGAFVKLCDRLGYAVKTLQGDEIIPSELQSYKENQRFSPQTFAFHQAREKTAKGRDLPRLLEIKSLPRSGLHYLVNSLKEALKGQVSFCEWYQEPGCCKKMPCIYSAATSKQGCLRLTKSHDFDFKDPTYPPSQRLRRVILTRDPLFILTSWWVLDIISNYKDDLRKQSLNVEMLFLKHEPTVKNLMYQAVDDLFDPATVPDLELWLRQKAGYIQRFSRKWMQHTRQNPADLQQMVRYEDLPAYISEFLAPFKSADSGFDVQDMTSKFAPRSDPFSVSAPRLQDFLHAHSQRFRDDGQEILDQDETGVFRDL